MKMPVGVSRSSGFQICDILDLNEQGKTGGHPDSEPSHSELFVSFPNTTFIRLLLLLLLNKNIPDSLQTMLPGSGGGGGGGGAITPEFNHHIAASLAAAQQAHLAAGLYSAHHTLSNQHDGLHPHAQWTRQEPSRHGK